VTGRSSGRQVGAASAVLAVGLVGWNAGNFAFFVAAGHVLGPERYGFVAALLALVVAAFIPLSAFQPVAARPFAVGDPDAPALVRHAVARGFGYGGAVLVAASLGLWAVRAAGAAVPGWEIALALASVVPIAPMFLLLGVLQGRSRFRQITVSLLIWGMSRPVALVALAPFIDGVAATLLANLAGTVMALGVTLGFARASLRSGGRPEPAAVRAFTNSLTGPLIGMTGLAVLFNVDVVVAKLAADPLEAGYFGAVATLAKAGVVLAPQVLGIALLPEVARRTATGREVASLGTLITGATVVVGLAGVAVGAVVGHRILAIYGEDFTPGAWMLAPAIAALIPLGMTFGLANYQIARGSDRFPRALAVVAAAYVAALAAAGRSVPAILVIEAGVAAIAIVVHEVLHRRDGTALRRGVPAALAGVRRHASQPDA